jgi:hypothetical protein
MQNGQHYEQGVALETTTPQTRVNVGAHVGHNVAGLRCHVTSWPCESLLLHVVRDVKPAALRMSQLCQ